MISGVGSNCPLPSAHGGGLGQVLALRALPGSAEVGDGLALAEVTYAQKAGRRYGADGAVGGATSPLLGGDTITLVQAVATTALPAGAGAQGNTPAANSGGDAGLTDGEQAQVQQLRERDASVRAEEESHAALAGAYASPIQYEYAAGPDGRLYVVNGSVGVSTAGISDPEQLASALTAMRSAGRVASGTSIADTMSAEAASRGLNALTMALADSAQSITQSQAQKAYTAADRLGLPATQGIS
jgi:hypothetical protein